MSNIMGPSVFNASAILLTACFSCSVQVYLRLPLQSAVLECLPSLLFVAFFGNYLIWVNGTCYFATTVLHNTATIAKKGGGTKH